MYLLLGIYSIVCVCVCITEAFCAFVVAKTRVLIRMNRKIASTQLRCLCFLKENPRINTILCYILQS